MVDKPHSRHACPRIKFEASSRSAITPWGRTTRGQLAGDDRRLRQSRNKTNSWVSQRRDGRLDCSFVAGRFASIRLPMARWRDLRMLLTGSISLRGESLLRRAPVRGRNNQRWLITTRNEQMPTTGRSTVAEKTRDAPRCVEMFSRRVKTEQTIVGQMPRYEIICTVFKRC